MKEEDSPWDRIIYGIPPPKVFISLGSLGAMVILLNEVRRQPYYIYVFIYFPYLDSNFTICKEFCDSIWFLFLII